MLFFLANNLLISNNNYNEVESNKKHQNKATETNKISSTNSINQMINLSTKSKLYGYNSNINTINLQNDQYDMNERQDINNSNQQHQKQTFSRLNYNFSNFANTNKLMNLENYVSKKPNTAPYGTNQNLNNK